MNTNTKIGVLGSGDVGKVLAAGFAGDGHAVKIGSRDPGKLKEWAAGHGRVSTGTFAEAATFGELIVIATAWSGIESALKLAEPRNFEGKVVIDATNPLVMEPNRPPRLALG